MADGTRVSDGAAREEIEALRQRIDELDERLVRLLNDRAGCALEIGRIKQALGLEIYQPEREREVLRHVRETKCRAAGCAGHRAAVRAHHRRSAAIGEDGTW